MPFTNKLKEALIDVAIFDVPFSILASGEILFIASQKTELLEEFKNRIPGAEVLEISWQKGGIVTVFQKNQSFHKSPAEFATYLKSLGVIAPKTGGSKPILQPKTTLHHFMNLAFPQGSSFVDIDVLVGDNDGKFAMIELLKNESKGWRKVSNTESHPRRYWKNWRKFCSLNSLSQAAKTSLYFVNFREDESEPAHFFKALKNQIPTEMNPIRTTDVLERTSANQIANLFLRWSNGQKRNEVA